jgi:hypothetical protein
MVKYTIVLLFVLLFIAQVYKRQEQLKTEKMLLVS